MARTNETQGSDSDLKPVEIHKPPPSAAWVKDELAEWPHFFYKANTLVRVFPPPEGYSEWMVVLYEKGGNPEQTYRFPENNARELAFERGEDIVRRLKPILAQ